MKLNIIILPALQKFIYFKISFAYLLKILNNLVILIIYKNINITNTANIIKIKNLICFFKIYYLN